MVSPLPGLRRKMWRSDAVSSIRCWPQENPCIGNQHNNILFKIGVKSRIGTHSWRRISYLSKKCSDQFLVSVFDKWYAQWLWIMFKNKCITLYNSLSEHLRLNFISNKTKVHFSIAHENIFSDIFLRMMIFNASNCF